MISLLENSTYPFISISFISKELLSNSAIYLSIITLKIKLPLIFDALEIHFLSRISAVSIISLSLSSLVLIFPLSFNLLTTSSWKVVSFTSVLPKLGSISEI